MYSFIFQRLTLLPGDLHLKRPDNCSHVVWNDNNYNNNVQHDSVHLTLLFVCVKELAKFGGSLSLNSSKCKVSFPPVVIINKENSLVLTLKDINDDNAVGRAGTIQVLVMNKNFESVTVKPVLDIGGGNYSISFTPTTLGDHVISVVVDGQHIPGSPHK